MEKYTVANTTEQKLLVMDNPLVREFVLGVCDRDTKDRIRNAKRLFLNCVEDITRRSFALTFKAGDSCTRVNHRRGLGSVEALESGDYFFTFIYILIIRSVASSEPWPPQIYFVQRML